MGLSERPTWEKLKNIGLIFLGKQNEPFRKILVNGISREQASLAIKNTVREAVKKRTQKADPRIKEVKISSRAHTDAIDEMIRQKQSMHPKNVNAGVYFLDFDNRLRELLGNEVKK